MKSFNMDVVMRDGVPYLRMIMRYESKYKYTHIHIPMTEVNGSTTPIMDPNKTKFLFGYSKAGADNAAIMDTTLDQAAKALNDNWKDTEDALKEGQAGSYHIPNFIVSPFKLFNPNGKYIGSDFYFNHQEPGIITKGAATDYSFGNVSVRDALKSIPAEDMLDIWYTDKYNGAGGNRQLVYMEGPISQTLENSYVLAWSNSDWGSNFETGMAHFKYRFDAVTTTTLHGYYDSPLLLKALYDNGDGKDGKPLPDGLEVKGHFTNGDGGSKITDVKEMVGGECRQYTDGEINFSAQDLKGIWDNLGQSKGRTFITGSSNAKFTPDIYQDESLKTITNPHFEGGDSSYKTRNGYLKAEVKGAGDKTETVPVKITYFFDEDSNKYHFRPWVFPHKDPKFPLNPVAISPYKDMVTWMKMGDLNPGDTTTVKTQEVIPGFLKVSCKVDKITATTNASGASDPNAGLDVYSPGQYYHDGAPWMLGDGQAIGIHQKDSGKTHDIDLTCWGERKEVGQADYQKIPLSGLVAIDAESTDGYSVDSKDEQLKLSRLSDGGTVTGEGKTYVINGFSSCNEFNKGMLATIPAGKNDTSGIITTPGNAINFGASGDVASGVSFNNHPDGRCGERNTDDGAIMGPSLMAVVPINRDDSANHPEAKIRLTMKGYGNQAIGLGVVVGVDTSNADYNSAMPPVLQYSSLSFHGARESKAGEDWSEPKFFNQNYYYYGSRLGKTAVPYHPDVNNKQNPDGSIAVRDGSNNDGIPSKIIELKRGNDKEKRPQPLITPTTKDGVVYNGGKWLLSNTAGILKDGANGATFEKNPHPTQPLQVKVKCGKSTSGETKVRAWADFNGNGVFDPDEASSVGTCTKQTGDLRSSTDMSKPTADLPWSGTDEVTLTFDYPTKHDLGAKNNVWMRVRAVDAKDASVIEGKEADSRGKPANVSGGPVPVNPDEHEKSETESAKGSWAFSASGETEDYLFNITGGVKAENDVFTATKRDEATSIPVAKNDVKKSDAYKAKNNSIVFLSENNNDKVTISENGKKAVVKGEGTYTVKDDGTVDFVMDDTMKGRYDGMSANDVIKLTPLKYGIYGEADPQKDPWAKDSAAIATIEGTVSKGEPVIIDTTIWNEQTANYQWSLDKEILAGNTGSTYAKEDSRTRPESAKDTDKVGQTYRLTVEGKREAGTISKVRGTVSVKIYAAEFRGFSLNLVPEGTSKDTVDCTFDETGKYWDTFTLTARASMDLAITCVPKDGKKIPAEGVTLKVLNKNVNYPYIINDTIHDKTKDVNSDASKVKLSDTLTTAGAGQSLGDVELTGDFSGKLKDLTIDPVQFFKDHPVSGKDDEAKAVATVVIPDGLSTTWPGKDDTKGKTISNEAKLCVEGQPDCTAPTPIPGKKTESSTTLTLAGKKKPVAIYIKKVSGNDTDVPQKGSEFAVYPDNNGKPGDTAVGTLTAVKAIPTGAAAAEKETNAEEAYIFETPALDLGKKYWLKEIKAPGGHQLLAEPVEFTIGEATAADKVKTTENLTLSISKGKSDLIVPQVTNDKLVIRVTDAEKAHLPAAGSSGLLLALLLGSLGVIGGTYWLRRNYLTK